MHMASRSIPDYTSRHSINKPSRKFFNAHSSHQHINSRILKRSNTSTSTQLATRCMANGSTRRKAKGRNQDLAFLVLRDLLRTLSLTLNS